MGLNRTIIPATLIEKVHCAPRATELRMGQLMIYFYGPVIGGSLLVVCLFYAFGAYYPSVMQGYLLALIAQIVASRIGWRIDQWRSSKD